MADEIKDVASTSSGTIDGKGVPWENRAKEFERKLLETQERLQEMEEASARAENEGLNVPKSEEVLKKEQLDKLNKFVEDPDAYIENKLAKREYERQLSVAREWIQGQSGITEEDKRELIRIERDYSLTGPPSNVAKSAYKILQNEKASKEVQELKAQFARETSLSQTKTEGSGKSVSDIGKNLKRKDIIDAMSKTQNWMDYVKYVDMLEDVKE